MQTEVTKAENGQNIKNSSLVNYQLRRVEERRQNRPSTRLRYIELLSEVDIPRSQSLVDFKWFIRSQG